MSNFLRLIIGASCLVSSGIARAQARPVPSQEEAAVRVVVERYLKGLKFNDTLSLGQAFWPQARLFYVKRDGQLGEWTQASWYASFAGSVGHEEQGDLRIAAVEVTRDAASVKVVEDYPKSRYTDYLSLLKLGGRWWIVNKIYTAEPR
jgi:hypothetical protein